MLVLLAVPLTVAVRIDHAGETRGQLRFRWLFGLVRFRVGYPRPAGAARRRRRTPSKAAGQRRPGKNARGLADLLKKSSFRRHGMRFIRRLLRAAHVRVHYLRLRIGLGDPAETGRLWSLLGAVAGVAAGLGTAEVRLEPEFLERVFEVESRGEFRLVPLQLIALVVAFVASPTTLRACGTLLRRNA